MTSYLQSMAYSIILMIPALSVLADTTVKGKIIGISLEQSMIRVQPDSSASNDDGLNIVVDEDSKVTGQVKMLENVNVGAIVSVSYYRAMKSNSSGIARGSSNDGGVAMGAPTYTARELNIIDNNKKWWELWK